jgi:hypothetical protein
MDCQVLFNADLQFTFAVFFVILCLRFFYLLDLIQ